MTAFAGAMMLTIELDAQDLGRITFADEPEFADEAVAEFVSRPAALGEMDVGAMRAGVAERARVWVRGRDRAVLQPAVGARSGALG